MKGPGKIVPLAARVEYHGPLETLMLSYRLAMRRTPPSLCGILLGCLAWFIPTPAALAQPTLLLTAETAGHLEACDSCPTGQGLGGLARRATLLNQRRDATASPLLADAGGLLFGAGGGPGRPTALVKGYNALDYDAVNLGFRDFRQGKAATLKALDQARFTPLSANLYHAKREARLFDPMLVRKADGTRIALIGLTEKPAPLAALPELQAQLKGVRIRAPKQALQAVLPRAQEAADRIVVLYYGNALSMRQAIQPVAKQIDAIVLAGHDGESLPQNLGPAVVSAPEHGKGVTELTFDNDQAKGQTFKVKPSLKRDDAIGQLVDDQLQAEARAMGGSTDAAGELPTELPNDVSLNEPTKLDASGESRGLRIDVLQAHFTQQYGGYKAKDGRKLLVLDTAWEDQIALDLIFDLEYPEKLLIASLPRQCYLLINGRRVQRLVPEAAKLPGHLPTQFVLGQVGAVAEGKLVYEVPAEGIQSLSLRYYHDQYAPVVVPLRDGAPSPDPDDFIAGPKDNRVGSFAVSDFNLTEQYQRRQAPDGLQYAVVGFRAKSEISIEADARALDAEAPLKKKVRLPKVMEYLKAPNLLQLVADGEYLHERIDDLSTLLPNPPLLPDVWAGGRAVFLVDEDYRSLELVCGFPQYQKSTGPMIGVPERVDLLLDGEPVEPQSGMAFGVVQDKPIPFAVMNRSIVKQHGTYQADENQRLLVLSVSMRNESKEGGLYSVSGRVALKADQTKGQFLGMTTRGGGPLSEPIWLGPGQRRSFELVFSMPAETDGAQLSYSGVEQAGIISIPIQTNPKAKQRQARSGPGEPSSDEPAQTSEENDKPDPGETKRADTSSEAPPESTDSETEQTNPGVLEQAIAKQPTTDPPAPVLEVGQQRNVNVTTANKAVQLTVESVALKAKLKDDEPKDDYVFMVLQTRWKNLRPMPEPKDEGAPTYPPTYHVRYLKDKFFCVFNNRRLLPIDFNDAADEHLKNHLTVPWEGQQERYDKAKDRPDLPDNVTVGTLVYQVPKNALRQVDLHLLDRKHGNMELSVLKPAGGPLQAKPIEKPKQNRLVKLGVYGIETAQRFEDHRSGSNHRWVILDLRGRSRLTAPRPQEKASDASADNAPAKPQPEVPIAYRWHEWKQYIHLVIDGKIARFIPRRGETLLHPNRFIPSAMAGGKVAFEVREKLLDNAQSIELFCDFRPKHLPEAGNIRPEPLVFSVAGSRPDTKAEPAIASIKDLDLTFEVVKPFRWPSKDDREEWSDYEVFQIRATAHEDQGTFLTPQDRLYIVSKPKGWRNDSSWSRALPNGAPQRYAPFWIPAGETRVFQMAWKRPADTPEPLLWYDGLFHSQALARGGPDPRKPTDVPANLPTDGMQVIHPEREPKTIQDVGLTPKQVNTAIDKARDYLWEQVKQESIGYGMDYRYPMLLALVHADAHETYPEFDRKLRNFLQRVRPNKISGRSTYRVGLLAMILEGYGDPAFMDRLQECAHYLVEDQSFDGLWDYGAMVPADLFAPVPKEKETPFEISGGRSLAKPELPEEPIERTQSWWVNDTGDNSVSQFATLGLWSAERAGIEIDDQVWRKVLRATLARQTVNDNYWKTGWGYKWGRSSYGSMTGAGLCMAALAIHHLSDDLDPKRDVRIQGGLKWFIDNWKINRNPHAGNGGKKWVYYYIYSLERVGQILGIDYIGDHAWYPEGAKWLIDQQAGNGSWSGFSGDHNPRLATSFALLFLTRATPELDTEQEQIARGGDGQLETSAHMPERDHNVYLILDASGSMLGKMRGQTKFDIAKQAVREVIDLLPQNTRAALRVYGHRKSALDEEADQDTELVIPWRPLDKRQFHAALDHISPRGKTPLALSLEEAAGDLGGASGSGQTLVVLLTDGGEDTRPPRDPTEPAEAFAKREDLQLYVLGFDINRPRWQKQLRGIAQAGAGQYLPVIKAGALARRLKAVVYPKPPQFRITEKQSDQTVKEARFGETLELHEGQYTLHTMQGDRQVTTDFWVNTDSTTRINFDVKALPSDRFEQRPKTAKRASSEAADSKKTPEKATPAPSDGPKFCTNCGNKLKPGANFCTNCGQKVQR
jgi:Mg-chelatase subunit ChlD